MKTYSTKPSDIKRNWHVIDAEGETLGRLASKIAQLLKGKHKPQYVPHLDTGDHVIVVNAEKIRVTGNKLVEKTYYRHTGYPGGLRETKLGKMLDTHPTRVIELAIRGMLPHNALGRQMFRKLNVYAGPDHPHAAQINSGEGKSTTPQKNARKRRKLKERLASETVEETVNEESLVGIDENTNSPLSTDDSGSGDDNAQAGVDTTASSPDDNSDETKENKQ
jgi:large subunit ribosomal protein L13